MPQRDIIALASSSGGLDVLRTVLGGLPADLPAAVLLVHHIGAYESILPQILSRHTALQVRHGAQGEPVVPGSVYIAPPDHHMLVRNGRIELSHGPKENFTRPAADPLFRAVAVEYGKRAVGVVLTGELDDGAAGLVAIRACGGYAIVQEPLDAVAPSMPSSAMHATAVDAVAPAAELASAIVAALSASVLQGEPAMATRRQIEWETDMTRYGAAPIAQLDEMGKRSTLTCPECGGTLWSVAGKPARYRCHTGHGYTRMALQEHQEEVLETALWATIRRLHERMATAQAALAAANQAGDVGLALEQQRLVGRCEALEAELHRFVEQASGGD
ncbi:chemotaxis protein CheB [Cupriavidus sp. AU9028]|uniref:chemotaxis protein CheB n=1 Tax=Cupriavidus sp. AU9028 TaxID=2871157 RepID=UPI001C963823|nr:chemotaxis protein CheB [Cupriavidus sp. AU9028]MBY4899164.1 chemotaxis protein CheB [Cupriavidus sp. AU9028]